MATYEIDGYDRGLHLHERSQTHVTLTPGTVRTHAQFAPGDVESFGNESWRGEIFEALGDPFEADLIRLEDDENRHTHIYEVRAGAHIPQGTKALVRSIVFGGDSIHYEEHEILETDNALDPGIGHQVTIEDYAGE